MHNGSGMKASTMTSVTKVPVARTTKKLEKPRPLQRPTTIVEGNLNLPSEPTTPGGPPTAEELLCDLEEVAKHIENGYFDLHVAASLVRLCADLKVYGSQLEEMKSDQLNRIFNIFRKAVSSASLLDKNCQLRLLEVIELRAAQWKNSEARHSYYRDKLGDESAANSEANIYPIPSSRTHSALSPTAAPFQSVYAPTPLMTNSGPTLAPQQLIQAPQPMIPAPPPVPSALLYAPTGLQSMQPMSAMLAALPQPQISALAPGEVLKSSGKYLKPTRIPAKNYYKDEIVMRNSDSGKVMGIKGRRVHMIEELSGTIVSFQRVAPGAKDRLVQITGPTPDSVERAKQLIGETIVRNASPIRSSDGSDGEYSSLPGPLLRSSTVGAMPTVTSHPLLQHSISMSDEYAYTVLVGKDSIRVSSTNLQLAQSSKLALEQYFRNSSAFLINGYDDEEEEEEDVNEEDFEIEPVPSGVSSMRLSDRWMSTHRVSAVMESSESEEEELYAENKQSSLTNSQMSQSRAKGMADAEEKKDSFSSVPTSNITSSDNEPAREQTPKLALGRADMPKPVCSSSVQLIVIGSGQKPADSGTVVPLRRAEKPFVADLIPLASSTPPITDPAFAIPSVFAVAGSRVAQSRPQIRYSDEEILDLSQSPLSQQCPPDLSLIEKGAPEIVRKIIEPFDAETYRKRNTNNKNPPINRKSSLPPEEDDSQ